MTYIDKKFFVFTGRQVARSPGRLTKAYSKSLIVYFLLPLIILSITACGLEKSRAQKLIRTYNEALIIAYRTGDLEPLKKVAGEKEVKKVWVLVDLKKNAGLVLESKVESMEVTAVRTPVPQGMEVETKERWRYYDRTLTPGKAPGKVFTAEMTMRYTCQKVEGSWKVMGGVTLSNQYIEP